MKEKNKKRLYKILPVSLIIVIIVAIIIIVIPKSISQKNYYNSLARANYTKLVQNTLITENQITAYEKVETIIVQNHKIYHKIYEKRLSSSQDADYDEIVVEYYYANDKMYYFEDNEWKITPFNFKDNLKTYELKDEYFVSYNFDKEVELVGKFTAAIKDENINDVFQSETNFKNAEINIVVDKDFKIQSCTVTANTQNDRDVLVENSFTYNQEVVELPV